MARAPLLQLSDISLTFGGNPLFEGLDLRVQPGDRIALVGRNGSGKSTLMKVMAGLVEADSGTRAVQPGVTVGYMEQEPDLSGFATLGDFAASGLPIGEEYRVMMAAEVQPRDAGCLCLGGRAAAGGFGEIAGRGAGADAA
jgi:ABC transport system ATP-binding/permease protein